MFNYMNLRCIMTLVAAPLIEMLLMTLNNCRISFKDVMSSHRGCLSESRFIFMT